ncbi:YkgJ family cysteine cluster protein [Sandaracinus amylolyticus]|uniref:YkgJ family cysteine cluster protein n=1 Tax=Sandaracinus amylolyticus TaxID=927083 RepID=UPI001F33FB63|nr:hypothetical protein [Sandaracinus amylolyticus]UJR82410.1 Hypothetical protein I5071_44750 [Sandaracinus amylolyticus]
MPVRARPLIVRPGARFACAGDGLCCADAHLLGPLSPAEGRAIRAEHESAILREQGMVLLRTKRDGACSFLTRGGRCAIHTSPLKPRTCHRYPFLLTATLDGGRIGTDHRCPCRTMGARPLLRESDAEPALLGSGGRLSVDLRAPESIPVSAGRSVPWATWRAREAALMTRLEQGERVESVLDAAPFPAVRDGSWPQIGFELADDDRPMRWARAHQWAGDAILALHGEAIRETRPRPWSDAFGRAQRRTPEVLSPDAMLADWIADAIWTLEWATRGSFVLARAELATRVAMARWIAARLESEGTRLDRAMAEAIAVVEMVGLSETWTAVLSRVSIG